MLVARLLSAFLFFTLFFLGLFNPWFGWALPVLLAIACLMSVKEFIRFGSVSPYPSFRVMAYAAALLMLADAYFLRFDHGLMIMGVLTVVSLAWGMFIGEPRFSQMAGVCLIATLYATLPLALITDLWREAVARDYHNGPHYIIFLVLVTQSSDIGAYFVGRWFGKHKLAPVISPGKTWEGFFGGLAMSLLVACLMKLLWDNMSAIFYWWEVVFLGALFAIVGPVGDLTESWLKRNAGIKDSGQTFTGHGGMLDIIDSLLFTTIFYYAYLGLTPRHLMGIF